MVAFIEDSIELEENQIAELIALSSSPTASTQHRSFAVQQLLEASKYNDLNQALIRARGGIKAMIDVVMAEEFDAQTRQNAFNVLINLRFDDPEDLTCEGRRLLALIDVLDSNDFTMEDKAVAVLFLNKLANDDKSKRLILVDGGVPVFMNLLSLSSSQYRHWLPNGEALNLLQKIFAYFKNQAVLREGGWIPMLVLKLHQVNAALDKEIKRTAVIILEQICTDRVDNQNVVRVAGGIETLRTFLSSLNTPADEELKTKVGQLLTLLAPPMGNILSSSGLSLVAAPPNQSSTDSVSGQFLRMDINS